MTPCSPNRLRRRAVMSDVDGLRAGIVASRHTRITCLPLPVEAVPTA